MTGLIIKETEISSSGVVGKLSTKARAIALGALVRGTYADNLLVAKADVYTISKSLSYPAITAAGNTVSPNLSFTIAYKDGTNVTTASSVTYAFSNLASGYTTNTSNGLVKANSSLGTTMTNSLKICDVTATVVVNNSRGNVSFTVSGTVTRQPNKVTKIEYGGMYGGTLNNISFGYEATYRIFSYSTKPYLNGVITFTSESTLAVSTTYPSTKSPTWVTSSFTRIFTVSYPSNVPASSTGYFTTSNSAGTISCTENSTTSERKATVTLSITIAITVPNSYTYNGTAMTLSRTDTSASCSVTQSKNGIYTISGAGGYSGQYWTLFDVNAYSLTLLPKPSSTSATYYFFLPNPDNGVITGKTFGYNSVHDSGKSSTKVTLTSLSTIALYLYYWTGASWALRGKVTNASSLVGPGLSMYVLDLNV